MDIKKLLERYKKEVKEFALHEVSYIKSGQFITKREIENSPGEFPVISSGKTPLGYYSKWNSENDPISVSARGTVGYVSWTEGKFFRGELCRSVKPKDESLLLTRYLYFALIASYDKIKDLTKGGIIPNLILKDFKNLKILAPSLETQEAIVKTLDSISNSSYNYKEESELRDKELEYYTCKLLGIESQYSKHFDNLTKRTYSFLGDVEFKTLADVTSYKQSSKFCVSSTDYSDDYPTPVLTAGKTFILGYTNEVDNICKASTEPCIIFDDFTTAVRYIDFDFKVKSSAVKMIYSADESKYLLKYIYYYLLYIPRYKVEHKRHWISRFSLQEIPIPSLEKQKEIVKLLDLLEELVEKNKQCGEYYSKALSYAIDRLFNHESLE